MEIIALSDTHGILPKLDTKNVDCVVIAGDVCPTKNHREWFQKEWLEGAFSRWVKGLRIPVYLALGNHDFVDDFAGPPNLRYSTQRIIDDVFLFSWVPNFYDWAWMADEEEIAVRLHETLREARPSIWVTHGPPYGVCDVVGTRNKGSKALREAIEMYQPKLVVCGHLHEGGREGMIINTRIVNVSLLNDRYHRVFQPLRISIDAGEIVSP